MKISASFRLAMFAAVVGTLIACDGAGSRVTLASRFGRHDADSTACFWVKRDSTRLFCEYFRAGASIRKDTSGLYE